MGQSITCYGASVGLRVSDPGVLHALLERLPPWRAKQATTVERLYSLVVGGNGDGRVRRLNLLYADAELLARTRGLDGALDRFSADVQLHVAERARGRVFVHAGVVGWRGRAIVIPGRSFSGKTTLVRELVRAGAAYYSDDYAVLDARGGVHPFPRPLSIRPEGAHTQERHPVEPLGGVAGEVPLPLGVVAVAEYDAGVRGWRPRRLSAGQGSSSCSRTRSRRGDAPKPCSRRPTAGARVPKARRGEAEGVAARILELAS